MCGIAGIFDVRATRLIDGRVLDRMTDVQSHRGPDERGIYLEPGVALGHRRLAIIDIVSGQQPMFTDDGNVGVVFNGQIYNYKAVREELKGFGYRFSTNSDTEIIGYAWKQWRERCVERFRGMFAFAVLDRLTSQLFIARDRIGIKPLHYSLLDDGTLIFASELKGLTVHPDFDKMLNPRAIEDYFAFGYIPDPKCIYQNAAKLLAGHTLTITRGKPVPSSRCYWDVEVEEREEVPDCLAAQQLIDRLSEAVDMRLMSEVPIGAFLSGGVDSSAIVALMAGLTQDRVKTCSIGFSESQFDETDYARRIAERYGTDHNTERVNSSDVGLVKHLDGIYDEPFADSSAVPTYRLCELARKHVTVALSGDGGDECLAGYRRYLMHVNEERVRRLLPHWLRKSVFAPLGAIYPKADWAPRVLRAKYTLEALSMDSVAAYFHSVSVFSNNQRKRLFQHDFAASLDGYEASEVLRGHAEYKKIKDPLTEIQYLDLKTYLPGDILTKVDRASMAHSLEVRVPILDHHLVNWMFGLPKKQKLCGSSGKHILKSALQGRIPDDILYREKKGFSVPLADWFRGELKSFVEDNVLGTKMRECGIFDSRYLGELVNQHFSGVRDNSPYIWPLVMYSSFLQKLEP